MYNHNPVIPYGTQNFVVVIGPPSSSSPSNIGQNTYTVKPTNNVALTIKPKPVLPIQPISSVLPIQPVPSVLPIQPIPSVLPIQPVPSVLPIQPIPTSNSASPLVDPSKVPFVDHGTTVLGINGTRKCFFAVLVKAFELSQVLEAYYKLGGNELFKENTYFTVSNKLHRDFANELAKRLDATFAIYVKYPEGWTRSPIITFGTGKKFVTFGLFPGDNKVLGHFVLIGNNSELDITVNPQLFQQEIHAFFLDSSEEIVQSDVHESRFDSILAQMLEANPNLDLNAARIKLETEEKEKEREKKEKELIESRKKQEAEDLAYASQLQIESDNAYVMARLTANPQADVGQILTQMQQMKI